MSDPATVLVIGDPGGLGGPLTKRLFALGTEAENIDGTDSEISAALSENCWSAIVVVEHDDARALRLTLLSAHLCPALPLWVTLFDRTIAHRLREIVPSVRVLTPAELVAREMADHVFSFLGSRTSNSGTGLRIVDDALRVMVWSGVGLIVALVVQIVISLIALHDSLVNSVYFSTRSIATVADVPGSGAASDWFKLVSTATTLTSVGLLAVFTAALVRRLGRPRLTTLFGTRRAVFSGHVLVVGFGQIGFRLAQELRLRGASVIALERDPQAPAIRLARRAGIPVAIGRGDDRGMLELLGVRKCAAVAAVTSDDLANVSTGLAATDVLPDVRVVLRLGDGNVAAETESLLHLGTICDAHALAASSIAQTVIESVRGGPSSSCPP